MTANSRPISPNADQSQPTARLVATLAAGAGVAVANIYYNQPLVGLIANDVGSSWASWIPTVTQLGYAAGLVLLVPLGDMMERRRLIGVHFLALAIALGAAALSGDGLALLTASFFIGLAATGAQQIVPLAADLAPPTKRGATVGLVMAGLLTGILLSRTAAGLVGAALGWRAVFALAAPLVIAAGLVTFAQLPQLRPSERRRYLDLLGSLGHLWRELPLLRGAALTQALLFAAFSVFWTLLALHLAEPPFRLGPDVAGLFGVLGVAGALAAPLAGAGADRYGARRVVFAAALAGGLSWFVFLLWNAIAGLVLGVIVLDLALQAALVANQHTVFGLRPPARARLNTVFMGTMFSGGAAGSALATAVWPIGGWPLACASGLALTAAAALLQALQGAGGRSL